MQLIASSEPSGTAAASSYVRPAGFGAITPLSRTVTYSVRARRGAEHLITDLKLCNRRADLLDDAGELRAVRRRPRATNAREDAGEPVLDTAHAHRLAAGHGGRDHPHEHLVLRRRRPLDLLHAQHVGRPVSIVDDCPHGSMGSQTIATLPRAWPSPR